MNIIKNKKILVPIIVFFSITILIIGSVIFVPKIRKMLGDAQWKKGIYILPTSQYHAFGLEENTDLAYGLRKNTTITQLNFVCVKETRRHFLIF